VDQEIQFLVANLVGPGIRRNGLPDDGDPVPTQAVFEQLGLDPQATSQSFKDAGERVNGADSTHGGIIAKTVWAISRMLKKSASGVLASLRGSTYRSVRLASSLAAALLDGLFEHPARHNPVASGKWKRDD
jgi:hypothetical protein